MTDSKPTLYIYGGLRPNTTISPPCGKAMMALAFKGVDYELVTLMMPQQVKKVNPRGRMPALKWGDETIVDSSDIVTALDQRVPDPPLLPDSPVDRARCRILEDWADEVLYFYGAGMRWGPKENFARFKAKIFSKLPIAVRQIGPILARREASARLNGQGVGLKPEAVVRRELQESLQALEDLLGDGGEYLVGDRPTRADLSMCAVIDQLDCPELTPQSAEAVRALPQISAWRERVHQTMPNALGS